MNFVRTTTTTDLGVSLRCAPGRAARAVGNDTTVANGAEPTALTGIGPFPPRTCMRAVFSALRARIPHAIGVPLLRPLPARSWRRGENSFPLRNDEPHHPRRAGPASSSAARFPLKAPCPDPKRRGGRAPRHPSSNSHRPRKSGRPWTVRRSAKALTPPVSAGRPSRARRQGPAAPPAAAPACRGPTAAGGWPPAARGRWDRRGAPPPAGQTCCARSRRSAAGR
jgi:hypothetical protein